MLGSVGGFVAGPGPLVDLIINRARSFIFTTAPAPAAAAAALAALRVLRSGEGDTLRARLAALSQYAARKLAEADAEHPFAPHVEQAALPPTNVQGLAHWQAIADWLLTADGALLLDRGAVAWQGA